MLSFIEQFAGFIITILFKLSAHVHLKLPWSLMVVIIWPVEYKGTYLSSISISLNI